MLRIVAKSVLEKAAKSDQSAVSGADTISSAPLQRLQESQDVANLQMFNRKLIDGPIMALGNVDQEQAQGITIGVQGMGADATDLREVIEEELLQQLT
jgi:hypothetical protein